MFSGAQITRLGVSGVPRGLYADFSGKAESDEPAAEVASRGGIYPRKRKPVKEPTRTRDLVDRSVDDFLDQQEAKDRQRNAPVSEPTITPVLEPEVTQARTVEPVDTKAIELAALALEARILEHNIAELVAARQRQEDEDVLILLMATI